MTLAPTLSMSMVGCDPIDMDDANGLLETWGHSLGPCQRPFGLQPFALVVDGQPISIAVSASIVSATVAGYARGQVVELARLCTSPDHRWATRAMLRLWREVCAPRWPYWSVAAAVAYSQNSRHEGRIYRFDGWEKINDRANSGGGGAWTRPRRATDAAYGSKTLWLWRFEKRGFSSTEEET